MAGSTYGNRFKILTWGESHGEALGVVVDGCPAGLELCEEISRNLLIEENRDSLNLRHPAKKLIK